MTIVSQQRLNHMNSVFKPLASSKRDQTYYFPQHLFTRVRRPRGQKPQIGIGLYCRGDEVKRNETTAVGDGCYER